jgi:putative acetyltransferase
MSLTVIGFDPQHKTAFKELNLEWIRKYFVVENKDVEQLENPEWIVDGGGEIIFALVDGEVVGTCAIVKVEEGIFELAKMAVSPAAQGKGISHELMRASEAAARARGAKKIFLVSNQSLTPAITLYKKHGYIVTSLDQNPEYSRGNIEMEKNL